MHCNVMNYYEILFLIIIVMQRNCTKHFPGGVHYPDAIFLMAIIWEYISVTNIILRSYSLSASCLRANYLGDNFRASNFRGAIILEGNCPGAIIRGGNCPGGNYPGGNCPVPLRNMTFINKLQFPLISRSSVVKVSKNSQSFWRYLFLLH